MCIFPIATSKRQLQDFQCFACVSQGLASSLWLLVFSEFLPDKKVSSSSWAGDLKLILRMLYFACSDRPPKFAEVQALVQSCRGRPVKFAAVDCGHVSIFSFDTVTLPMLPDWEASSCWWYQATCVDSKQSCENCLWLRPIQISKCDVSETNAPRVQHMFQRKKQFCIWSIMWPT